MALSTTIKVIQDIMRKDVGVDGDAQRIGQLAWMLFLKILDDREQEYERLNNKYTSPIPNRFRWSNWANDPKGMAGDELIEFINNDLFYGLRKLSAGPESHPMASVIRSVFEDAHNYMKSGALVRQVISKINEDINFKNSNERHLFGDIYEQILRDLQSAGNAGEYYTPRAVTDFIVKMVDPKLGERILDPACGTGGFLTSSIEHIRSHYVRTHSQERILQDAIFGVEKKPLPHLLCITNMLLHGIDVPAQICRDNMLSRPIDTFDFEPQVDVIITNPPFGGSEEDGIEINFPADVRTKESADLFIVLILYLLKHGGRAAIILPDGFLYGEGVKTRIKEKLLRHCDLHTIVRLPKGVFNPYTDITTNILFLTKGKATKTIWYYEHPYPPGYKSYSKTKPIDVIEFNREADWWNKRRENENSWKVCLKEIRDNDHNLDIKNPFLLNPSHGNTGELLSTYQQSVDELGAITDLLKAELLDSLARESSEKKETFFDYFSRITASSRGIPKLRELVLKLSIQGRLVPQHVNDEPVLCLLERIKREKERLIKERIIKTYRSLPPINANKLPFQLPSSWQWVRLGEIARIIGGGTPKTSHPEYFSENGNGIPWLTPADLYQLKGKFIRHGKRNLTELGLQRSSAQLLPKGTVVFSSRAPIGYVAIAENELATNQGFKSCVPFLMEMNEFIYYFLAFAGKEIDRTAPGTTFKEVSGKRVQQILVPLPPHEEQRRIIIKIDRIMDLINKLEFKIETHQRVSEKLVDTLIHRLSVP